MVLLLTLTYCGLVWLIFYKLQLLKFTKGRKIAVVAIGVVGLLYLVIALGRYMPSMSGAAFVQNQTVEIRADVSGRVTQVWITKPQDVKQGDPLFQVDPDTYRYRLEQAEAALAQAKQDVEELKAAHDAAVAAVEKVRADLEVLKATMAVDQANVAAAEADVKAAQSGQKAAEADVANAAVDVRIGKEQYQRTQELVRRKAATQSDLDADTRRIESAEAALQKTQALEVQARDNVAAAEAQLRSLTEVARKDRLRQATLQAQLAQAQAGERQAQAALDSTVDGEHTLVRRARGDYELAKWDYDHTTVHAPMDGTILNPQLRVGTVVKGLDKVMTFVSRDQWIITQVPQSAADLVRKGNPAELAFPLYPGRIFHAEVAYVAWGSGEAQVTPTGQLPDLSTLRAAGTNVVILRATDPVEGRPLRFGAGGTGAIYTDNASVLHIVRKVILRIESWLNYLG